MLTDPISSFPRRSSIEIIAGKTLTKTGTWHKAMLLVNVDGKRQLRLFGWRKNKEGEWRVGQKFNISKGYAAKVSEILDAFVTEVE